MATKQSGIDGIAEVHSAISLALKRAAQILINEFSYDGEDPQGVKAYQDDVDYFNELADKVVDSNWLAQRECK